jgi:hypothetical protein
MPAIKISNLFLYPIKGCGGCKVTHLTLAEFGALHDHEYMLVDKDNKFISQRTHPKLAQVQTLVGHDQVVAWVGNLPEDPYTILDLSEEAEAEIDEEKRLIYEPTIVKIHDSHPVAFIVRNEEAQRFFRDWLKEDCTLVRFLPKEWPRIRHSKTLNRDFPLLGQDGHHLLVTSEESLADLNRLIILNRAEPVPMNRFRPNVVVSGGEMYEEDVWSTIATGDVKITFEKLCDRCSVPQVHSDGTRGKEPARTLATYRKGLLPDNDRVCFGSNYSVVMGGRLQRGDAFAERV